MHFLSFAVPKVTHHWGLSFFFLNNVYEIVLRRFDL